ncbi:hypothetical protein CK203_083486 [Vitis vinifera]|uniref:Uncharacterized protein n=1 Tax=Vitis vinifera TaxID=29760 RepID=A0A438C2R5_VITVI|nr:hypothetical protein CK203_083486 [Vitis vinifera]
MSALEAVISCDEERLKLEKEAEVLAAQDDGAERPLIVYMSVWKPWMHQLQKSALLNLVWSWF